jgi:two-component sensor histidine kinase
MAPARRCYAGAVHLGLFAIGTLIPVLAIVAFMLIDSARLRGDDSLHDARLIAQHLNATIDLELEKSIAVAQTLAAGLALDAGDEARVEAQARDVAKRLGVNVVVRELSGQQIINAAEPPGSALPVSNAGIVAADRVAAEQKSVVISDLQTGTLRKVPMVLAIVPVLKDSRVISVISSSMSPNRFSKILEAGLPEGWIAGVIGRDGRLIARSTGQDRYLGTDNPAFLAVATGSEGVWRGKTREGTRIAGVYMRSPLSGWIVSVAVPEAILGAPVRSAMFWLVSLVIVSLSLSGFLGWRLSRRISLPIRDLAFQARELGEGRTPAATRSGVNEINDVTEALQAASVELDRRASATEQATEAVRANEERLQLVQETAGIGTVDWDIQNDRAVCSPRYYHIFSLPPGSRLSFAGLNDMVHPDERDKIARTRNGLFERGGPFEEEFRILPPAGEERWIYARGRIDLKDARPVRLFGAYIDITERKGAEQHLRFLLRELSHRSKNLLAVIQAMAGQTAKSAESVDIFRRRFGERLMGLAASHDLLVNQNWLGASVKNLVIGQLAPFVEANDRRLSLRGPDVDLKSEAAEAVGLALHELATNSLRFGALSDQAGKVEIVWEVYESETVDDRDTERTGRRFRMDWIEHTVDPVTPPTHKGFGRMVIEHTVEITLRGTVSLDFAPGGLRWRLDAPATCLTPVARGMAPEPESAP